jgi:hypothetical protein
MWLVVDRTEENTVILQDDGESRYTLSAEDYTAMAGEPPVESLVLDAQVDNGRIVALTPSPEETERRRNAARERLRRLAARPKKW